MMDRAKQLGGELLGSSSMKAEKRSGEMTDTKALKEALKLAKHKGDHRDSPFQSYVLISDMKQIDPRVERSITYL